MIHINRFLPAVLGLSATLGIGQAQEKPPFEIDLTVATEGFDKKMCWVHGRAGAIPPGAVGNEGRKSPFVVMTLQKLQLSGSDIFYALNQMTTPAAGESQWTPPIELESFRRVPFSFGEKTDLEITVCDFWPGWHAKSGKLLGTGHTVVYENNRVMHTRPRGAAYAVFRPETGDWTPWRTVKMPNDPKFVNCGSGCVQRVDLENGDVLLPVYFKALKAPHYATTVLRCAFDGTDLKYLDHGSELSVPIKRGLYEPSLAHFKGRFFLTMRNDDHGYIAVSEDGKAFSEPKKWTFDDGSDLGNYNTQQHWVTHPDGGLFLVYTRRGADNDHVFRHRAPLFIARVDPEKLQVIRATEQILVPEKGARLGNFGVTRISDDETWVTVTEWMQRPGPKYNDPEGLIKLGANNRVWVAKLRWRREN
ncbi:MAG: exo-alpha-sialidase [Verrucomicrobiales bacterium]|nr:exo-alpha-sialidase [Verrucomicrobiales bacterium]